MSIFIYSLLGGNFPGGSDGEESACNAGDMSSIPGLGRSPWRREWQPTPIFLPGEFHGHRRLACYSPWGRKESDANKQLTHTFFFGHSMRHVGSYFPDQGLNLGLLH